jgi:5'-methylthioinosine phosphorylase
MLGVIGGTGFDQLEGYEVIDEHPVSTPFGECSRPIQEGRLGSARIFFLQRHGAPMALPPHLINYRANVWAMRSLGVDALVGVNAVGGISPGLQPGRLVVPDQIIDYTWGREHTFDDGASGQLLHIDFTEPYDRDLRMGLLEAARSLEIPHVETGVHGVMQGPRLESAAEIQRMARDGCDVVGMTGMPEASLARECGLRYACVCMVVNAAAGLDDKPLTLDFMRRIIARESSTAARLLAQLAHQLAD